MVSRPESRNWATVRTGIQALTLAALIWSGRTQLDLVTQVAVLQENVLQLRAQLADVPGMANRITRNEVRIENIERRLGP
jgi:hypothetical protein